MVRKLDMWWHRVILNHVQGKTYNERWKQWDFFCSCGAKWE